MSHPDSTPRLDSAATLALTPTADGSQTFYSPQFGEWFHSRDGAYQEAYVTYIEPTRLAALAQGDRLRILDICYGLGYNTAAALDTIWRVNPQCKIDWAGLELNLAVPQAAIAQNLLQPWPPAVQATLAELAAQQVIRRDGLQAKLWIGDARQSIQSLNHQGFQADVIFFDPFSPPHCPPLWTVDFFRQVANCLKPTGRLATYSCAAAVRAGWQEVGLHIGATPALGRQWPGTLVGYGAIAAELQPLSPCEQEHLQTRAAVPYRDPDLTDTAAQIQARRQLEQQASTLLPTSQWRRRWLNQ